MRQRILSGILLLTYLNPIASALRIYSDTNSIEHTSELIAIEDYYKGENASVSTGGVPNLLADDSVDLATNAETQSLRQFYQHKNLRMIATGCETSYRLVANSKLVTTLADLKGKRIGTIPGTSAGYFVQRMLANVGLNDTDYTIVSGSVCLSTPCGSGTFPAMLKRGTVDAVSLWEPSVQLAAEALDYNVVFFQNKTAHREIFSLHSTTEKLSDPTTRKTIVAFLKAWILALKDFQETPEKVWPRVASRLKMNETVLKEVWPVHSWPGVFPSDLLDVLVAEDHYVAKVDNRTAMSREILANLIDTSVLEEAMKD